MPRLVRWLVARSRSVVSRLRNAVRADRLSDEIEREMAFHLGERTDDLVAGGMPRNAAVHEARRRFGNLGIQKERTRDRDLVYWLDVFAGDLRYAVRSLRSTPGLALVAVLSLGLGIGANTAIFTLINAVMLKSLPVRHPEELVALVNDDNDTFTNPLWERIRDEQDVFTGVFAYGSSRFNLATGGEARRADANWVSGDFFQTLGVRPALGRTLTRDDDRRGCPGVTVLGYGFWQSEYAGAETVVGKSINLDGHPFQIVGVTDANFGGLDIGRQVQVYVPICTEAIIAGDRSSLANRSHWFLQIVGRPKPGLTHEQLRARFATLAPGIMAATLPPNWPADAKSRYLTPKFDVTPAARGFSELRGNYGKALIILMGVVAMVLLIACANVANLLLARATARQREIAVRLALGASSARLVRQLLTESLMLAAAGAALGVAFAAWGSRVLVAMLSRTDDVVSLDLSLDLRVLAFTIVIAMLTGILFGLAPAWRGAHVDPQSAMKASERGIAGGDSRLRMGRAVVVGQIALSLVLVTGAGLLLGSWRRLATVDAGYQRDHLLVIGADIRGARLPEPQYAGMYRQILERLRGLPGASSASASVLIPMGRSAWNDVLKVDGYTPKSDQDALVWFNEVSDGYFATMGTRIIAGRDFDARDVPTSTRVALVSETMAKKFFGSATAVGKRFRTQQGNDWSAPIQIIGVVRDAKYRSLREEPSPIAYVALSQNTTPPPSLAFELRVDGAPATASAGVKAAMAQIDPRISLDVGQFDRQLAESLSLPRTLASLSGFFGGLALMLAMIGLYGTMSYSVARRRNEIGVRIALGAARGRVVQMVLGEVGRMVAAGVVIGAAITLAVTRLVATFLYGVEPTDPTTLVASALALLLVALGAATLPAWRAARLDPVAALRED